MKVALAQINATVGDLAGNARLLAQAARQAYQQGAMLVVSPELSLTGYPPEDLLLRPAFMAACAEALAALAAELADCVGLHLVVGHPHQFGERGDVRSKSMAVQQRFNAASVLSGGQELVDRADDYLAAGITHLITASGGPDYDMSALKALLSWRDNR